MKGEARFLIQELRQACRQSLFNGISAMTDSFVGGGPILDQIEDRACSERVLYAESETGSTASSHKVAPASNKRARTERTLSSDAGKPSRSWDLVREISEIIYQDDAAPVVTAIRIVSCCHHSLPI
jgi:hypothetical protein